MNKMVILLSLLISTITFANSNDLFGIIDRPYPMLPLIVIDKDKWDLMGENEKNVLQSKLFGEIAEGGGGGAVGAGNGGYAIKCDNSPLVLLDYFEATLPTLGSTSKQSIKLKENPLTYFKNIFRYFPNFQNQFIRAYFVIGKPTDWVISNIKESHDINPSYLLNSENCPNAKLIQIANQQGETIFVNGNEYSNLSSLQKNLLTIHETLYYLGIKYNSLKTSERVRQIIRLALSNNFRNPSVALLERMREVLQSLVGKGFNVNYSSEMLPAKYLPTLTALYNQPLSSSDLAGKQIHCNAQGPNEESYTPIIHFKTPIYMEINFTLTPLNNNSCIICGGLLYDSQDGAISAKMSNNTIKVSYYKIGSGQIIFKLSSKTVEPLNKQSVFGFCTI